MLLHYLYKLEVQIGCKLRKIFLSALEIQGLNIKRYINSSIYFTLSHFYRQ